MVKIYSDLDEIDDENYGPRPLKDFSDTCYYEVFFFLTCYYSCLVFFLYFLCPFVLYHQILFLFFSTVACTCAKFRIISQQVGYSYRRQFACKFEGQHIWFDGFSFSANHAAKNNSCEDVLISALQILIDASANHFVRAAYNNASAENRTDTPTENAIPKSCGKDYPSSDRNAGK